MKEIHQSITLPASPSEVYEVLLDEKKHSAFTGAEAKIHRVVGGEFTAYDGWISGKIIAVAHDKKIVQLWKGNDPTWPKDHFSVVTFHLSPTKVGIKEGTKLILAHENVPDELYEELKQGWKEHYWEKMKEYFKKEKEKNQK